MTATVRPNATMNDGTDAPIAYDGVGRWLINRVQNPRPVGWYSHSYATKPQTHAATGPTRNGGERKIASSV